MEPMPMTEVARALENAAKEVLAAADLARSKGYGGRIYYQRIGDAYRALVDALAMMRLGGEIDLNEYERILKGLMAGSPKFNRSDSF